MDRKHQFFSSNSIADEIFNIGIKYVNDEEMWKKYIKQFIKKKHNYDFLKEIWQDTIDFFEEKIYLLIDIFNKREIEPNKLSEISNELLERCELNNKKIKEELIHVKPNSKYYLNFNTYIKRQIIYIGIKI